MRLIDADALIEEFEEYEDYVRENSNCFVSASETSDVVDYMRELAMRMPTVEAEPVVHGEWIDCSNGWMCSVCNMDNTYDKPYCPNCGAKMDGKSKV